MAGDWPEHSLSDLVEDILDRRGVTPLKLGSDFTTSGYRVISAKLIKDRRVDLAADEARFVDADTYAKWMRTPLQSDDVILTSEAPLGEVAYLGEAHEWCLGQRLFGLRTNKQRLHGRYLFYALQSEDVRHDLLSRATGTTAQGIRQSELRHVRIAVPPLHEQRAIAHILGTLDDKIELNRRMNETLEEMARALFKSWFVDFDPVRAKAEGRDPGLPKHLAALFPSRFVDSELGEIPDGWHVATLKDVCEATKGVSYKGSGLADAGMPLHNLNSVHEGGGYKYAGIKHYTGEFADRHVVLPGDLLVANTEQGHGRLLIGYAAIVPSIFGERGIASHHIYRVRALAKTAFSSVYLCRLLNSHKMHELVSGYANGTTVNMLPVTALQHPMIVVPPSDLIRIFSDSASAMGRRYEKAISESASLAATRDALLPKLISGELRVKDAESFIAKVTA
jgi:type I restriction enzyme, S subunit